MGQFNRNPPRIDECTTIRCNLHNGSTVHFYLCTPDPSRWRASEKLWIERYEGTNPHHEGCKRDPNRGSMVQGPRTSDVHRRFPPLLGDLHRASLHLCFNVGASGVHAVWNSFLRLYPSRHCDVFHYRLVTLFPAFAGGSSLVVDFVREWRNDWIFHLRVFFLLLFPQKWYEWFASDLFLFWLHGNYFIRNVPHARKCWIPAQLSFC
mmetsp:Transcript_16021/g.18967  ORF Transcript_16021/g.18967 Transcript_16021/m.18967 type:complete len:207 (-) Transcript_16021:415-1035(-)